MSPQANPHVAAILQRIERMHPNDTVRQRRALAKWAGVLRACEPGLAETLMSLRLVGSGNDRRAA